MTTEMTARVGADGVLTLAVPLGPEGANKTVHVSVKIVPDPSNRSAMTPEEWSRFVHSMAGRINDPTFDRQPQGEYEQREELL
jgi:hypothetical protein